MKGIRKYHKKGRAVETYKEREGKRETHLFNFMVINRRHICINGLVVWRVKLPFY